MLDLTAGAAEAKRGPIDVADEYILLGDYDNALNQLNLAIQQDPNNVRAAYNLAAIYSSKNDIQKAIMWLEHTLNIDSSPAVVIQKIQKP